MIVKGKHKHLNTWASCVLKDFEQVEPAIQGYLFEKTITELLYKLGASKEYVEITIENKENV